MVGSARTALAALTSQVALPVCPIHSPSGSAISNAIASAIAQNAMCARSWSMMPVSKLVLCQLAGSVSQLEGVADHPGPPRKCGRRERAEGARSFVGWWS